MRKLIAVVELFDRRHRERRRALVVERAARGVFAALALQRHARPDQLDDIGAREQVVDECVGDAGHGV
jgi:hypothetical protein